MDDLPQLLGEADIRLLIESAIQARKLQALDAPTEPELQEMCLWVHRMAYWTLLIKSALAGKMLIDISPSVGEVRFMINPAHKSSPAPPTSPLVDQIEDIIQSYKWDDTSGG